MSTTNTIATMTKASVVRDLHSEFTCTPMLRKAHGSKYDFVDLRTMLLYRFIPHVVDSAEVVVHDLPPIDASAVLIFLFKKEIGCLEIDRTQCQRKVYLHDNDRPMFSINEHYCFVVHMSALVKDNWYPYGSTQVSHMCHNSSCIDPNHVVVEHETYNYARSKFKDCDFRIIVFARTISHFLI